MKKFVISYASESRVCVCVCVCVCEGCWKHKAVMGSKCLEPGASILR